MGLNDKVFAEATFGPKFYVIFMCKTHVLYNCTVRKARRIQGYLVITSISDPTKHHTLRLQTVQKISGIMAAAAVNTTADSGIEARVYAFAREVATRGLLEGSPAHGIVFVMGDARKLIESKTGVRLALGCP